MTKNEIRRTAPAKINLALHVIGQRQDGHHLLETLVVFSQAGDHVRIAAAPSDSLEVTGPFSRWVGPDEENLVVRARDLLRREFPDRDCGAVAIRLEKNLPSAAGLGSGSSDAAATLLSLAELWGLPRDVLQDLALSLGADLPMCVMAKPLIASGIGEILEPLEAFPPLNLLLVHPGGLLPTGNVFATLAEKHNPPLPPLPRQRSQEAITRWLAAARNDLEPAAASLHPPVGAVLTALRREGASVARMSGSGATCYGLFENPELRDEAAAALRSEYPRWFVMQADTDGVSAPARQSPAGSSQKAKAGAVG